MIIVKQEDGLNKAIEYLWAEKPNNDIIDTGYVGVNKSDGEVELIENQNKASDEVFRHGLEVYYDNHWIFTAREVVDAIKSKRKPLGGGMQRIIEALSKSLGVDPDSMTLTAYDLSGNTKPIPITYSKWQRKLLAAEAILFYWREQGMGRLDKSTIINLVLEGSHDIIHTQDVESALIDFNLDKEVLIPETGNESESGRNQELQEPDSDDELQGGT